MQTMQALCGLVTVLLLAGNWAVLGSAIPTHDNLNPEIRSPEEDNNTASDLGDVVQTDTLENGFIVKWYGNATQEALIADVVASNGTLSTLDFLAGDPSLADPDEYESSRSHHLSKRQCSNSGIHCTHSFGGQGGHKPTCQGLLSLLSDRRWELLPYFPHAVCVLGGDEWWKRCCLTWTSPVLSYYDSIIFPSFLTYTQCELGSSQEVGGVAAGYVMGGVCQNICLSAYEAPAWCGWSWHG